MVGNNTVAVNIVDVEGCIGNIMTTEDILVRIPDLDLTISGNNPICFGATRIIFSSNIRSCRLILNF